MYKSYAFGLYFKDAGQNEVWIREGDNAFEVLKQILSEDLDIVIHPSIEQMSQLVTIAEHNNIVISAPRRISFNVC